MEIISYYDMIWGRAEEEGFEAGRNERRLEPVLPGLEGVAAASAETAAFGAAAGVAAAAEG